MWRVITPPARECKGVGWQGGALSERVRSHLAGRRLPHGQTGQTVGRVTVSMGLAAYAYGEPLDTLLKRADTSLYAAKSAGRNRATTEAEETAGLVGV
jgi:diguanylate cyclase